MQMPFWLLIQNLVLSDKPIGLLLRRLFLTLNSKSQFSPKSLCKQILLYLLTVRPWIVKELDTILVFTGLHWSK